MEHSRPCDLTPWVMFRRGTLPVRELDALVPRRSLALVESASAERNMLATAAETLSDALHEVVPQVSPEVRRRILKARRSVHNGRALAAEEAEVVRSALGESSRLLSAWSTVADRVASLEEELAATFQQELGAAREALKASVSTPHILAGLQLSGEHLYHNALEYVGEQRTLTAKRRRGTEAALVSFAYRAALKPSPFGGFAQVGAALWDEADPKHEPQTLVSVRWARMFLNWLEWLVHRDPESREHLNVRLNSTLEEVDGGVRFLRQDTPGLESPFPVESFVRMPRNPLLDAVRGLVGLGRLSRRELVEKLQQAGAKPQVAAGAVDRLSAVGCLEWVPFAADQDPQYTDSVADYLHRIPTFVAAGVAAHFSRLAEWERTFGAADLCERSAILREVQEHATQQADSVGVPPPTADVVRSLMFEDRVTSDSAATLDRAELRAASGSLEVLMALLPLFDSATVDRSGLRHFFDNEFGPAGRCGFLTLYERFLAKGAPGMTAVMTGENDPGTSAVLAARRALLSGLAERLRDLDPTEQALRLDLDDPLLAEAVAAADRAGVGWSAASLRLQVLPPSAGTPFVWNGAAAGRGVTLSRFAQALDAVRGGESLVSSARSRLDRRSNGRQADITAAMGLNFNLHPPLAPLQVEYPGCLADPDDAPVLDLRDLWVTRHPTGARLGLEDVDGREVRLAPLNYLFPPAGPSLYRFLCTFAEVITLKGSLWDRMPDAQAQGRFPRLVLGDVVVDRARRTFPVREVDWLLPDLSEVERWRAAVDWRCHEGLAEEAFCSFGGGGRSVPGDWRDETREWSLEARRAKLRKPHYLHLGNPSLLTVIARHAASVGDGSMTLTECLPDTSWYGAGGAEAAEELVVELELAVGEETR